MCKNITVIDDYQINLRVAEMIIKHHGFFEKIDLFDEASKALENICMNIADKNALPDVILLDLNMPVMDGWQFLEEFEIVLKSLPKRIDIYILSSSTSTKEIQRSKQNKIVKDFLSKPLTLEMLESISEVNLASTRQTAQ